MSVHTKIRRTKRPAKKTAKVKERLIPWREAMKDHLKKYTEAGVMLRAHRHKAEMTQSELAEALNVGTHQISEMENGKRPIDKEMAKKLGEVFKCNYRAFL